MDLGIAESFEKRHSMEMAASPETTPRKAVVAVHFDGFCKLNDLLRAFRILDMPSVQRAFSARAMLLT